MEREECYICGETLDLFSKDTFTGQLCHFCFNKQPIEWQENIKSHKNDHDYIQGMMKELKEKTIAETRIESEGEEKVSEKEILSPKKNELKVKTKKSSKKKTSVSDLNEESVPLPKEERLYFHKDMENEEIESLIQHRVFIMEKMKYFADIQDIKDTHETALLDMIRHQMEILINQNELIIRELKKKK